MSKILAYLGIAVVVWATIPDAIAQKSTELFIPIGKSPGVSGKCSVIGTIDSVDSEHTVFMHDSSGEGYHVKLTDETKIYLDKSTMKQTNQMGTYANCMDGVYCEVLYKSHKRTEEGEAEWIKLRITADMKK